MLKHTSRRLPALLISTTLLISACATVDVSGYSTPEPVAAKPVKLAEKGNVITRTAVRLYDVFVDRGWYEEKSRKRVQSTANILLNGLEPSETQTEVQDEQPVIVQASSASALMEDIKTARYHIVQTTKAADIYLDVASGDAALTNELKQLQKALRVSEQAASNFSNNPIIDGYIRAELSGLEAEVNELRRVTDSFGDAVRSRRIAIATQAAS